MKQPITCKLVANGIVVETYLDKRTVYQYKDGTRYVKLFGRQKATVRVGKCGDYYYNRCEWITGGVVKRVEHPYNSGNIFVIPDEVRKLYRERRHLPKDQWFPSSEAEEVPVEPKKGKPKRVAGLAG